MKKLHGTVQTACSLPTRNITSNIVGFIEYMKKYIFTRIFKFVSFKVKIMAFIAIIKYGRTLSSDIKFPWDWKATKDQATHPWEIG